MPNSSCHQVAHDWPATDRSAVHRLRLGERHVAEQGHECTGRYDKAESLGVEARCYWPYKGRTGCKPMGS